MPIALNPALRSQGGNTRYRFHITRNEYDKSRLFGVEWRLLQVVFSTRAFVSERVTAYDIEEVLELKSAVLGTLVPPDTNAFKWMESAEIQAPADAWQRVDIALAPDFTIDSFRNS